MRATVVGIKYLLRIPDNKVASTFVNDCDTSFVSNIWVMVFSRFKDMDKDIKDMEKTWTPNECFYPKEISRA